ncbi:hypothetical protein HN014_10815 [Aquimarina sp. TRL1]|uniref:hypothetical protein n=1 Tax=Aquimarina sp. (strain TRL1) TaxID=2736252 RepID=UPI00158B6518|nr:hypothetical protein [Aquimarina sp. TRL1]QKX05384.1 hypothetical protein HN014_10815 [Aquimarina sp. TRL1]
MAIDYKRSITHENYGEAQLGLQKYYHKIDKQIHEMPRDLTNEKVKKKGVFIHADNNYLVFESAAIAIPLWGGGMALFSILCFIIFLEEWDITSIVLNTIAMLILLFFIIYYFTMPKKEYILNRKDGLITFSGLYWQPNITMHFDNAIFTYSTGGEDGTGAYRLEVIRPTKGLTFASFYAGGDCFYSISLITWYMDKNRPLPPGDAFDKYRQRDFERRKAAGFPKPLYFSKVPTPEATPEQQDERKRIGGW